MKWITDANGNRPEEFVLEPFHRNISERELFQNLADMWNKLGRQPKFRDCYPGLSKYSGQTYADRFGAWRKALAFFVEWASSTGVAKESLVAAERVHRTPRQVNLRMRAEVLMRDFSTCQLCGAQPKDGVRLEVDHIVPWADGGETVPGNLQALCMDCNNGKSDTNFFDSNAEALEDMRKLAEK